MKTCLLLTLSGCAALAACGGGTQDAADGATATATKVEWPLLDDEGRFMPSLPGATPETASVRTRTLRYATMAAWLYEKDDRRVTRAMLVNVSNAAMCAATVVLILAARV